jgi:hypothetical protein
MGLLLRRDVVVVLPSFLVLFGAFSGCGDAANAAVEEDAHGYRWRHLEDEDAGGAATPDKDEAEDAEPEDQTMPMDAAALIEVKVASENPKFHKSDFEDLTTLIQGGADGSAGEAFLCSEDGGELEDLAIEAANVEVRRLSLVNGGAGEPGTFGSFFVARLRLIRGRSLSPTAALTSRASLTKMPKAKGKCSVWTSKPASTIRLGLR